MSLGLSDDRNRRRRRQQVFGSLFRWGLALAVGVGVGFYAHDVGKEIAQQQVTELNEQLTEEIEASEKLRSEIAGLHAALRTERDKVAMWRNRYESDVPGETEMPILAAVRERLEAGVSPERIRTVVSIARDDVACEPLGETKRFFVNTEISRGANGAVSFANGTITITGDGTAARNANGQPEAWFDPDVPVTVNFSHLGGEVSQVTGLLPVHNSMAIGDVEYRFTAVAGARSFVRVTGQKCPIS
jgi:hypothetical protein